MEEHHPRSWFFSLVPSVFLPSVHFVASSFSCSHCLLPYCYPWCYLLERVREDAADARINLRGIKSCSHVYIGCLYYPQQKPHQEQSKKAARCLRVFKLTRACFHCEQKENCYFISPWKIWFYLQDCIVTINHVFPPSLTCGDITET